MAFWKDLWASPMAAEYLDADIHGLYIFATLVEDFWDIPTTAKAAEIRQQRMAFGLTPIDRRRLEWSTTSPEEPELAKAPGRVTDPRAVLKAIS